MRWKYPDPIAHDENRRRQSILRQIDAWWSAFQSKTRDLEALFKRQKNWDLVTWMNQHLSPINESLMWEFGPGLYGGERLVITSESNRHLRPLVNFILERAPRISGWEFYPHRLPENLQQAISTVKARTKGDISATRFKAATGRHNRIDLAFTSPTYSKENHKQSLNDCFVAIESLLGEEVLDKWIGFIDVAEQYLNSPEYLPLDQMLDEVKRKISEITKTLPDEPCFATSDTASWTLYELKPAEADDYPHQLDMYVGRTMLPDMWTCAHSGAPFYSSRFSRNGELFAYLKIDGTEGVDPEKFTDKAEIEDALDAILIPEKLGAVIGGGTGKKYSYIDLALTNPEAAFERIRIRLRKGNIPKRSWILFFDTELSNEWIGIWDDTPPPPV